MAEKKSSTKSPGTRKTSGDTAKTGTKKAVADTAKTGSVAKEKKSKNPLMPEVISLITIGLGFLLVLCVFVDGSVGVAGQFIQSVLRGFFGIGAYILPIIVISMSVYALLSKGKSVDFDKILLGTVLFLCVLSITSSMNVGTEASYPNFFYYIVGKYDEGSYKNGGLVGYAMSDTLTRLLGKPGSYVVLMIIVIATAILLTGKSLYAQIKRFYEYIYGMSKRTGTHEEDEPDSYLERMAAGIRTVTEPPAPEPPKNVRKPERVTPERRDTAEARQDQPPVNSVKPQQAPLRPLQTPPRTFVIEDRDDSYKEGRRVLLFSEETRKEKKRKTADPLAQKRLDEQPPAREDDELLNIINEDLLQKSMADKMFTEHARSFVRPIVKNEKKPEHETIKINGLSRDDERRLETLKFSPDSSAAKNEPDELSVEALERDLYTSRSDNSDEIAVFKEEYEPGEIIPTLAKDERYYGEISEYDTDDSPYDFNPYREADSGSETEDWYASDEPEDIAEASDRSVSRIDLYSQKSESPPYSAFSDSSRKSPERSVEQISKPVPARPEIGAHTVKINTVYEFPDVDLLNVNTSVASTGTSTQILENSRKLEETLRSFGIEAKVVEVSVGPTVTRYEIAPGAGVKVSTIASRSDDLALSLAAEAIRIEAPIPGKSAIGIELPNKEAQPVLFREIVDSPAFKNFPSKLTFGVGKDITGNVIVHDLARMPHLMIAGATGSGKSVCINTLIASILYKSKPEEVKLIMIDPKVVELSIYNGIPHLMIPVVTDPKKALSALNWAVAEMDNRYNMFAEACVRDLKGYNQYKLDNGETDFLPLIVIIIDELADLMMTAAKEVEGAICRLAQKARACGIHLIIATQRPSSKVITGLIKANIPSRLAFAVTSGIDSRIILDMNGAEKLLGKGDMLFLPVGMNKPVRIQGGYISDKEVEAMVTFLRAQQPYEPADTDVLNSTITSDRDDDFGGDDVDEFFNEAVDFIVRREKASASMLQRQFRIGYNRASRLIEELEVRGIVGPEDGSKPRKVLVNLQQWNDMRLR